MTLNLPQMLHDLNHYHFSRFSFRVLRSTTPQRRFLGLAATCRTYRGILPHLVVVPPATHLRSPPPSLRPPFHLPDTLFSQRSTILLRFTAYHTRSPPAYRDDVLFFLPRLSLSAPFLLARITSAFLFREASQFQTCQFLFISARSCTGPTTGTSLLDGSRLFRASSVHLF